MKSLQKYTISQDEKGVSVVSLDKEKPGSVNMPWSDVVKVHGFKRDLFSFDCVCIFLSRADDSGVELDEHMEGWKDFIELLPKHLIGCQTTEQWLREVTLPPFETKLTVIFSREPISSVKRGSA